MRTRFRFLVSIALGALFGATWSIFLAGQTFDFVTCMNGCTSAKQSCFSRCSEDCRARFPNDSDQRNACVSECKELCMEVEKECKNRCLAIKKGESPSEP